MTTTQTQPRRITAKGIHATPGAMRAIAAHFLTPEELQHFDCLGDDMPQIIRGAMLAHIKRIASGDWGAVCEEDAELNSQATHDGSRILACYPIDHSQPAEGDNRLWLIADAADDANEPRLLTFLLPADY